MPIIPMNIQRHADQCANSPAELTLEFVELTFEFTCKFDTAKLISLSKADTQETEPSSQVDKQAHHHQTLARGAAVYKASERVHTLSGFAWKPWRFHEKQRSVFHPGAFEPQSEVIC